MEQSGATAPARTAPRAFDENERARIRAALRHYMKAHGIGAPALQVRIIEADAPRMLEIPLKTLQRFLGGTHRTSDAYVALCYALVKDEPYYSDDAAARALADGVLGYFVEQERRSATLDAAQALESSCGTYFEWRASSAASGQSAVSALPAAEPPITRAGALALRRAAGTAYFHARHWRCVGGAGTPPERRRSYEGILVAADGRHYLVLRDCLTREPLYAVLYHRQRADEDNADSTELEGESVWPSQDIADAQGSAALQRALMRFIPATAPEPAEDDPGPVAAVESEGEP